MDRRDEAASQLQHTLHRHLLQHMALRDDNPDRAKAKESPRPY
jgi:hypothetical protein